MSKYNAFRRKLDINENCIANYESSFIVKGTSAVKIYSHRLDNYKQAAIIMTDKEGPDTSLVYTFRERAKELELLKGDYYTWNNNIYLVFEDVNLVRDIKYKKQKSYQCNVSCSCGNYNFYGYYVSSLAKYVDTQLQGSLNISDKEQPILILPSFEWVKIGAKIIIKNKPYKIIEFDAFTNEGIVYCSLSRDFIDKQADGAVPQLENVLIAGIEQELDIKFGYFNTDCKVDIVEKTYNKVKFIIPYGIEQIAITTKDDNKIDMIDIYKVVV